MLAAGLANTTIFLLKMPRRSRLSSSEERIRPLENGQKRPLVDYGGSMDTRSDDFGIIVQVLLKGSGLTACSLQRAALGLAARGQT
jgi:hypothetical protein